MEYQRTRSVIEQQVSLRDVLSDKTLIIITHDEELPKNLPPFGEVKIYTVEAIERDRKKFAQTLSDDTFYMICDGGYASKDIISSLYDIDSYDIILEKRRLGLLLKIFKHVLAEDERVAETSLDVIFMNSAVMDYILSRNYRISREVLLRIISGNRFRVKYVDTNMWQNLKNFVYIGIYELIRSSLPKYLIVGVTGILLNEFMLKMLSYHLPLTFADAFAIETSITSNFLMNEYWTFNNRDVTRGVKGFFRRMGFHNLTSLIGLGINLGIFTALVDTGMEMLAANLIGIAVAFLSRYLMSSRIVWHGPTKVKE
ncbi:GtrA family protein [Thermoplasma sp.]|uniref:GtrA family protein n=1 Tax=Thermoplasma sp. TaxID=1973142 RepID=UPI0012863E09|nr:GtrA family protein [Thermoplasma sp.]KAA8923109.1 MAG: GtrA family protein [Thermoplasma sp.]